MAVTDIIGFSFFIILPGCLPALLSLVTVDRSISPAFSHRHTPPGHTPFLLPVCWPTLARAKFPSFGIDLVWLLTTALLWFVRDRSHDRLLNYSTAKRRAVSGAGKGHASINRNPSPNRRDLESQSVH
ncbi:hypothetical protein X777_01283 [Ooceraea biroi]|uniref:Uncharacterized protein n=1 Tax=Ooceraea biroi TaxID=2015173 RepID=A0A026WRK8_OOCBI|nr:hypothetical protein X777_01283 [Ooceraea biroi]